MLEGNKTTALRIGSWNSGSKYLINQMPEIKSLIGRRKPRVLVIQEANLWNHHSKHLTDIDEYTLLTTKMINDRDRQCSRLVVYVKEEVKFTRLSNYETNDLSSIWLELSLPHQRKIVLGGVYREHNHLKTDADRLDYSSVDDQVNRWENFTSMWEKILDEKNKETIVIGDMNFALQDGIRRSLLHEKLYQVCTKLCTSIN